ncbi:MAG: tetratricopeptide repeat protein [Microcoleaceae cyanobacterium]
MDYQALVQLLPNLYYNWGHEELKPDSDQFQQVRAQIQGDTSTNVMELLNATVDCMAADEIYCEMGTVGSSTLIAALLGHPECMAYAVGELETEDVEKLAADLQQFELEEQVIFCQQPIEAFLLELREIELENKIGVYFYQGESDYRSVLLGLLLIKPFLANKATIFIKNYHFKMVQQAVWDFIAVQPECQILLDFSTLDFGDNILLLSWDTQRTLNYPAAVFQEHRQQPIIQAINNLQQFEQSEFALNNLYKEAIYWHQQQQFEIAEKKYKDFLVWQSDNSDAWLKLGILYIEVEDYSKSLQALLKSIQIDESQGLVHYYIGFVFEKLNQNQQAIAAYQTAIEKDNQLIDAYNNLGNLLYRIGAVTKAETIYRKGILINQNNWGIYLNLGNLLFEQYQIDEAITFYKTALKLNPDYPDIQYNLNLALELQNNPVQIYINLGNKLYQKAEYQAAIDQYQKLLAINTVDVELYSKLSECYRQLRQRQAAIETLQTGTQLYPKSGQLHFSLITELLQQGQTEAAIHQAEIASKNLPDDYTFQLMKHLIVPMIYPNYESISYYRQRFETELQVLIETTVLNTPENRKNALLGTSRWTNFYLAYQAHNVVESQKKYGDLIYKIMAANYPEWTKPLSIPPIQDKIRVGYVSHYLHSYSGTLWLTGWLKYCNHEKFEVYCYYTGNYPDVVTQQFKQYSDVFHHIPHNLAAVCQQIIDDKLHILVYPEIGMDPPTLQMAALRLAPIQCTAWGHPVTTGLKNIDYFLSSELMEAENAQSHYSETLIKLPNIGVAYPKPKDIPTITKKRSDFNLSEDNILYFCCQAPFKYLPQYDYILPAIARQVNNAKFLFLRGELLKPRLEFAFAKVGLNHQDYCIHLNIPARQDYLMLNLLCDVFLDTITWSGGNTSLEAIACNLPIVTYPGKFMRGRHADSFLKLLGVTDTIAKTEAEYIDIAVKLGIDSNWKNSISERMSQRHNNLFDDPSCVKALESFYEQIVRESYN